MVKRIFDFRMCDGSRNFADLPQVLDWYPVRDHVSTLPGARLTGFLTDHVTEAWIDFTYRGHRFSINDQNGDYWFFVKDPGCDEQILDEVLTHWEAILGPSQ
jgi:hypothetical protein